MVRESGAGLAVMQSGVRFPAAPLTAKSKASTVIPLPARGAAGGAHTRDQASGAAQGTGAGLPPHGSRPGCMRLRGCGFAPAGCGMSLNRFSAVVWGVESHSSRLISPLLGLLSRSVASPPPAVGATAAPNSARLLVTAHRICGEYPAGRAHRAGRGREPVRCSRPGCRGPRAPLSHTTPAVFAAQRCERNVADMSYLVELAT